MSIPGAGSPLFLSAAAAADAAAYQIDRSLRFNDGDSAYLSRTPSSVGNKKTFTWSGWIKRTEFGGNKTFFSSANGNTSNPRTDWQFNNDKLYIGFNPSGSSWLEVITNRVFRDPSAWYHIVVAVDTTQGTNTDRVKVYVNGVRETSFSTYSTFTQDSGVHINSAVQHSIGRYEAGDSNYFPGYLAEVYFIDGQALAATDFGEEDSNGVWQPKAFSGSYTAAATGTTTSLSQTGWQTSDQANIWDGDTNTRSVGYADNQVGTVTFNPPLTNVTKVEVYQQDYVHYLNGSSVTTSENGNPGWHVLYNNSSSPITLNSLGNSYSNNTQTVDIFAIRINDSIVDSQTWTPPSGVGLQGTGVNSFYLKFAQNVSNSALGTDSSGNSNTWTVHNITAIESKWSDYLTTTGTFASNQGPEKSFDNSLSAADVPALDAGHPLTWSPPGGLAYSSKVEIYVGAVSGFTYSLNGASAVTATTNAWNTVATGSGTINTLVFDRGVNETHGPHAIRVDNVVLVDGTTPSNTDSLIDTPTNYTADSGNNGGCYCTMNPLRSRLTLSNGNLDCTSPSGWKGAAGTIGMSLGKWYWEIDNVVSNEHVVGIVKYNTANVNWNTTYGYGAEVGVFYPAAGGQTYGAAWTTGDVIGVAFDADNGILEFYKNGTSQGVAQTGLTDGPYLPSMVHNGPSRSASINFGQRPWHYSPKADHVALCTTNFSDPTIADGSTAFDAALYTGNGSTQSITGLNHSPDFVWIKCRSEAKSHSFFDSVRGATKLLKCDVTQTESTQAGGVTSFDSNGFSIGSRAGNNENNSTFVAWAWDAGTSTVSNTDGSITSNVRANTSVGFSICTYTSPSSSSNQSFGHGLNAKPDFVIVKNRDTAYNWDIYHSSLGYNSSLIFTNAATRSGAFSAEPTSSVVNTKTNYTHNGTDNYVALCWTAVDQYSAFGSYEGTASSSFTDPFIYTGFQPRWILIKNIDNYGSGYDWFIFDTARDTFNVAENTLKANLNAAEADSDSLDILSNGFRIKTTANGLNLNSHTHVWAAFAEHPFKTARAR